MTTLLGFFRKHYFFIFPLAITLSLYILLFGVYTINDIDNPWTSAWIYNFFQHHITYDIVFCDGDTGYWGVRFFSHIFCYLYGFILSFVGFGLHTIQLISYGLIILGLFNWFFIAKTLLKDKKLAFIFIILLALSCPVLNAANEARSDAFVFFLISLSFLLWIKEWRFLALLCGCMAVETHPIGAICFFYLFTYFICYERSLFLKPHFLLQCFAGVLSGVLLYLSFHYSEISHLTGLYTQARDSDVNNFLYAYFYSNHQLQFKEDFFLFVAALLIHFIYYKTKDFYFVLTVGFVMLSSLIFTRANSHYVLFAYPAFWLLTVHSFSAFNYKYLKLEYVFVLVFLFNTNHYINLAKSHQRGRHFGEYISQLKTLNLPKESYIYGSPVDYFAFYDYPGFRSITNGKRYDTFYLLEHLKTIYANDKYDFDSSKWKYNKIKTLSLKSGGFVNVYQVIRN